MPASTLRHSQVRHRIPVPTMPLDAALFPTTRCRECERRPAPATDQAPVSSCRRRTSTFCPRAASLPQSVLHGSLALFTALFERRAAVLVQLQVDQFLLGFVERIAV